MGKWSINAVVESQFSDGMLRNEDIRDNIPHNKMILGFREEIELLFIDLVSGPQIRLGDYKMLDASNLLIRLGGSEEGDGDGDDNEMEYEIFQLTSFTDGQAIMSSFERADGDEDFDMYSFEITMTKNDGTKPSVSGEETIGTWEIIEVEDLSEDDGGGNDGGADEGPQVGMQIGFDDQLGGMISLDGQMIFDFEYELLDLSNILMIFEEESDGGNVEENYNLFHVGARPGGNLELYIYLIRGPNDDHDGGDGGDNEDGGEDANLELEFRVILQKR